MGGVKRPHLYCPGTIALCKIHRHKNHRSSYLHGAIPLPYKGSSERI
eukprot:CCRYP_004998-RA/>CCRYP_004998-RA protein AED:0.33 eAED:0.33 QI:0/-1/0/1/-1/0/1/0/46